MAYVRGHFKNVHGTLNFDPDNPRESSVEVEIYTNELWTGDPERDEHLKGADFVDYTGWQAIDAAERSAGEPSGRPRVKLTAWERLLDTGRRVASSG